MWRFRFGADARAEVDARQLLLPLSEQVADFLIMHFIHETL